MPKECQQLSTAIKRREVGSLCVCVFLGGRGFTGRQLLLDGSQQHGSVDGKGSQKDSTFRDTKVKKEAWPMTYIWDRMRRNGPGMESGRRTRTRRTRKR